MNKPLEVKIVSLIATSLECVVHHTSLICLLHYYLSMGCCNFRPSDGGSGWLFLD